MKIKPTKTAIPKTSISPWRVLKDILFLRRRRVLSSLFLFYTSNNCRMREVTLDPRGLVRQNCEAQAVVVPGLRVTDLGLRLLELGLAQFDD